MLRPLLLAIAVAAALTGTAAGMLATPTDGRTAASPRHAQTPTQVTVTRPRGFAWREALLGAAVAGALVTVVAAAAQRRTTSHPPSPRKPR